MPLNWDTNENDMRLIQLIVQRIAKQCQGVDKFKLRMDIEATHNNGNTLNLQMLLEFNLENLAHDILGINKHLNRTNGQLEDCFVPRCSLITA